MRSRTGCVINFANFSFSWVSKIETGVALSTLYSEYVELCQYFRDLLTIKNLIKEVVESLNLGVSKLKFISKSAVYEYNQGAINISTVPRMNYTSKYLSVKCHCFL